MTEKKSAKVARPRPKPAVIREPLSPLAVLKTLLADHGFSVREDPEVGLSFMFEGGQYHLPPQGNDQEFYHLLFPNFWALESDEEYGRALLPVTRSTARQSWSSCIQPTQTSGRVLKPCTPPRKLSWRNCPGTLPLCRRQSGPFVK
ncbi:hypothetical protein ACFSC4_17995 [Deinococcus malanensis]|uniref:hypothetical protein n=1 Tax=Deinococcus malanensis TaxID=1706855 RepID=UPI0036267746